MNEIIISSSYEAAYLRLKQHQCRPVPKEQRTRNDCVFHFPATKRLEADRELYQQDVDIQEFVFAHRILKSESREILKRQKHGQTEQAENSWQ